MQKSDTSYPIRPLYSKPINILLFMVSCAVTIIILEIGLRTFLPDKGEDSIVVSYSDAIAKEDEILGYRGIPNAEGVCFNCETKNPYVLNSRGFRDRERTLKKTNGKTRAIAVGDSFTWGVGVEQDDVFTRLLEKMDSSFEVLNASVPGWSTEHEYRYLETEGVAYGPDIILVGFFVGNDLLDNGTYERDGLKNVGVPHGEKEASRAFSIGNLQDHSRLYRMWKRKRRELKVRWGMSPIFTEYDEESSGWKATTKWIDKFKELTEKKGMELVFVLIPSRNQFFIKGGYDEPQKMLKAYLSARGISHIDLLPAFMSYKKSGSGDWGYMKYDGHWNELGHEIAAREIYAAYGKGLPRKGKEGG